MASDSLSFDEALAAVRAHECRTELERVPVEQAAGRLLFQDVASPIDHPEFTNSAMDGYAVRSADLPGSLWLVGESRAGHPWEGSLEERKALRISTGARLPKGADAILRLEDARESGGWVSTDEALQAGTHVRRQGEEVSIGDVVMHEGDLIRPHEVITLAALGLAHVPCRRRVRVAIAGSGDELVRPGQPRAPGQVYDANLPGLKVQVEAAGGVVVAMGSLPDDRGETERRLGEVLEAEGDGRPDLLVTTGGVSVGRHDHLRPALLSLGVEQVFWGVAIRPGHPLLLGSRGDQVVLALPGNPVSSMVCFRLFGRELLGLPLDATRMARLAEPYSATTTRTEFIRCRWRDDGLVPALRQGSHAIGDLAGADALGIVPAEVEALSAGDAIQYVPLD
ncbi:MAG: molybdopterin molybdotransferase MoeA [Thermoleophilia bacterium]|nr:molybdopterin molybdotransferase MoeA [Thermoleophilia bacterium]MDH3724573.1 molybdopterin molybdotransferase MoeA [Thermoleophilia bacterium]